MKILVVQDHLRSGGTERQSVFLSNAFAAAGHATTLLTFRPGGRIAASIGPAVHRETLQPLDLRLDWFAPRLRHRAAALAPEIVLCMGRIANCYAGRLQVGAADRAVVATMRTGKTLPALFRRSLQTVRHVVANSREARDRLVAEHGVPADKVTVIYNSLLVGDAYQRADARESLRQQHGAGPQTIVLLCVAMFRPEKNQRELIETISGLPAGTPFQLWLAGDGPARTECELLAVRKGLTDRVRFVGFHADPAPFYAAADVAVHASWSDALSNFVIEAQGHGLPAVVYDAQGMRECMIPGRTGWVFARGDHEGFRRQLLALMAEAPATRQARSDAARTHVLETFDPERQVRAYLELFSRLAG